MNEENVKAWRVLRPWQLWLYNISGLLMVAGAFAYATVLWQAYAWCIYTFGVIGFVGMQSYASYLGTDTVMRRLRRQQLLSCMLLVLSALALTVSHFGWWLLVGNTWLLFLVVATVFQVYTAFRIPAVAKRLGI